MKKGTEKHSKITLKGKKLCSYQYTDIDGEVFGAAQLTLKKCREMKDEWLEEKKQNKENPKQKTVEVEKNINKTVGVMKNFQIIYNAGVELKYYENLSSFKGEKDEIKKGAIYAGIVENMPDKYRYLLDTLACYRRGKEQHVVISRSKAEFPAEISRKTKKQAREDFEKWNSDAKIMSITEIKPKNDEK